MGFCWINEAFDEYVRYRHIVLIGGADNFDATKVFDCPDDRLFARVNSHSLRQGGPSNIIYHTCIGNPNITADILFNQTNVNYVNQIDANLILNAPNYVFLNLVDGDYEHGNKRVPTYYDFILDARIISPETNIGFFAQGTWENCNPYGQQYEWLNRLHKKYNCNLFTGSIALAHLLQFNVAQISVVGMDLFREDEISWARGKRHNHDLDGNAQFLWDVSQDPRIDFDAMLQRSLMQWHSGKNTEIQ